MKTAGTWRQKRALILRYRGWLYQDIGHQLGVTKERARQIVFNAATDMCGYPRWRHGSQLKRLERAMWLMRMQEFNRQIAKRWHNRKGAAA